MDYVYIGLWEGYPVYLCHSEYEAKQMRGEAIFMASTKEQRDYYRMYMMGQGVGWCKKDNKEVVQFEIPTSVKLDLALEREKKKKEKELVPEDFVKEVKIEGVAAARKKEKAILNSSDFWSNIEKSIKETLASVGGNLE